MKRISYLLSMYSLALLSVLSSCGDKDKDPAPTAKGPTVAAVAGTSDDGDYITADERVFPGQIVTIKFIATKGDKDLKTFTVTENGNNLAAFRAGAAQPYSIPGASQNTYVDSVKFNAKVGENTYVFTATDNDGKSSSLTIKLTAVALKTLPAVTFNGDDGTKVLNKGQFLATSTGANGGSKNFSATTAGTIDVTYDTENGMNKFYSPDAKPTKGTLTGLTVTKYQASTLNFTTATALEIATAVSEAEATATKDIAVEAGGTYLFFNETNETAGLIKVTSFEPGNAGQVTFDLKALQ